MSIITISRQFGTGGEYVAEKVAKLLNYRFINKEIIKYISLLSGVKEDKVKEYDEEVHSNLRAVASKFIDLDIFKDFFVSDSSKKFEEIEFIDEKETLFKNSSNSKLIGFDSEIFANMVERVLHLLLNDKGSVVLGRGGQCILKNEKNTFHIRLVAPFDYRVKWLVNNMKISEKEAKIKILEIDKRKEIYQ